MGKVVRYSRRGMKKRETQCLKKSKCRESWSRCEYVYRDTCTVHLVYLCVIWRNTDWVKQISVDHIQIRMKCVRWHLRSRSRYTHTRQYSTIAYKNPPIQSVRAVCVCTSNFMWCSFSFIYLSNNNNIYLRRWRQQRQRLRRPARREYVKYTYAYPSTWKISEPLRLCFFICAFWFCCCCFYLVFSSFIFGILNGYRRCCDHHVKEYHFRVSSYGVWCVRVSRLCVYVYISTSISLLSLFHVLLPHSQWIAWCL